jgi:diaminopimelate epimerase
MPPSPKPAAKPATPFIKMHGLGNDFVVLDGRVHPIRLDDKSAAAISSRHTGVGCDQLIVIEKPKAKGAEAFLRIRNADGGEVEACGNAARCLGFLLMRESGKDSITLETLAGLVEARNAGKNLVAVDMGKPRWSWRDIPLARECDTDHLPLSLGPLSDAVATSMGNPHATFFVKDVAGIDIATLGPRLEHDPLFPQRANIGVAQIISPEKIRLRVWERGTGLTPACGTGACAALVAAHRRGLAARQAEIVADGGSLAIEWRSDDHVLMTGPVAVSFTGALDPSLLPG